MSESPEIPVEPDETPVDPPVDPTEPVEPPPLLWPPPIPGNAPDLAGSPWLEETPLEVVDEPAPTTTEEAPDA